MRLNPRALEIASREAGSESAGISEEKAAKRAKRIAQIAPWKFKPGQSGNPAGRPKRDVSSEIAQAVFEKNTEGVYKALAERMLATGDPYAFKELAERGYGKLKESLHVDGLEGLAEAMAEARKRAASE